MADSVSPAQDGGEEEMPLPNNAEKPQINEVVKIEPASPVEDGGKGEALPTNTENSQIDDAAKIIEVVLPGDQEVLKEPPVELIKETESTPTEVMAPNANSATNPTDAVEESIESSKILIDKENCDKGEQDLLKIIEDLRNKSQAEKSVESLQSELKVREEQIDLLKSRVTNLETKLEAVLAKPSGKNHEMIENIKQQHEELLNKARGMIFDKTKMVKNQELQIAALTSQVQSLKDVNVITKDLLEIRNSEVKAMEERLQVMEARFKAEKERYDLVLRRAQTSTSVNDDLRKEYETQLAIFKELREKYEQRVQALTAENNRLKDVARPTA